MTDQKTSRTGGQLVAECLRLHGVDTIFTSSSVVNNSMFGTIRMHQEREYPGRAHGTGLVNPDFAAYARAFGASGELVEKTGEFGAAFERALGAGRAALLELRVDPEAITPKTTLTAIRDAALKRRGRS